MLFLLLQSGWWWWHSNEQKIYKTIRHLCVNFLIESSFLHFQFSFGIGHLGVCLELDIHHLFLAFSFLRAADKERGEQRARDKSGNV